MKGQIHQSDRQNWTVVGFGFLALALAFSARAGLGLIMPVWQREFGWSSSYISGVGATALIVMALVAPFAGRLVDKMGPRFTLNLGLGLLGAGCSIVAVMNGKVMFIIGFAGFGAIGFGVVATHVVATAVMRSFDRNTGLATGVAMSGATGGQFLIVPMIASLMAFISWRWSFGALGLMSLALIPCIAMSIRPGNNPGNNLANDTSGRANIDSQESSTMAEDFWFILKRPAFHALFWSYLICGFTTTGVIETHLLPFASFCGFPPLPSATAFGVLSAVNLLGMIAAGWLTDRVNRPMLLGSIYVLRGFTFIFLGNLPGSSIENLFLFAIFFGVVDYSTIPVTASLVASHIGLRVMGLAMGIISAGHAVGGAMGAFLGGYVFDTLGNYDQLWEASLWVAVAAGAMVLLLKDRKPDTVAA